jgi:hypothetical protein
MVMSTVCTDAHNGTEYERDATCKRCEQKVPCWALHQRQSQEKSGNQREW